MVNINTKEYWENRFKSGNWNSGGRRQTREYAKSNVQHIDISSDFIGTILDFGCAQGDAIPIYAKAFPKAKIYGIDISETAIATCKKRFSHLAHFQCGDSDIVNNKDVIIASHIMEHLTNDKQIVKKLIESCTDLYVFVPYKENPLYREHVNFYDFDYYNEFNLIEHDIFSVNYKYNKNLRQLIVDFLRGRVSFVNNYSKQIIMFHIKGNLN